MLKIYDTKVKTTENFKDMYFNNSSLFLMNLTRKGG